MTNLSPGQRVLVLTTVRDALVKTDGSTTHVLLHGVIPPEGMNGVPVDRVYPTEPVLALIDAVLDMDHARDCRVYGVKADSERNCNCAKRALSDPTTTALVKALGEGA